MNRRIKNGVVMGLAILISASAASAQDFGYRYFWEGHETEAVSYKRWSGGAEDPMNEGWSSPLLGAVCSVETFGGVGPTLNLCQLRKGTCQRSNNPLDWGYNLGTLNHCTKTYGLQNGFENISFTGIHAYAPILRDTKLRNMTCVDCNLHEAFFDNVDISGSSFYRTNFWGVEFAHVNAQGTKFHRAHFLVNSGDSARYGYKGATEYYGQSNFESAEFIEAAVQATFNGANLRKSNFYRVGQYHPQTNRIMTINSDLQDAYFGFSKFVGIDFQGSHLSRIDLHRVEVGDLYSMRSFGSSLRMTNLNVVNGVHFTSNNLNGVNMSDSTIGGVFGINAFGGQLTGLNLQGTVIKAAVPIKLVNIDARSMYMNNTFLQSSQNFRTFTAQTANLQKSVFVNTDLSGAKFCNANLLGSTFTNVNLMGAQYDSKTILPFSEAEASTRGMIKTDVDCD